MPFNTNALAEIKWPPKGLVGNSATSLGSNHNNFPQTKAKLVVPKLSLYFGERKFLFNHNHLREHVNNILRVWCKMIILGQHSYE